MNKAKLATAERLWRNHIKSLFNGRCFMCEETGTKMRGDHAHHLTTCGHRWLRFHPLNGVYLCFRHHDEVHTKGDKRLRQLIEIHHPDWHEAIEGLRVWERQQTASFKKDDLDEAIKVLEGILWPATTADRNK